MARKTSAEALQKKIHDAQEAVVSTKAKYESAVAELKRLMEQQDKLKQEELRRVIAESGLSYDDVLHLIRNATLKDEDG